ncbi:hypothetical protein EVAR_95624_1 [Eumeta japonica]|uniref:Uncharacterized protein n=1 Tax=Eumeta variegata TaxID=151549 RepID=A0A4C1VM97_EUMVA|nr:hypothetical protein EVAR_95624_1 [Eumeta japonica]
MLAAPQFGVVRAIRKHLAGYIQPPVISDTGSVEPGIAFPEKQRRPASLEVSILYRFRIVRTTKVSMGDIASRPVCDFALYIRRTSRADRLRRDKKLPALRLRREDFMPSTSEY